MRPKTFCKKNKPMKQTKAATTGVTIQPAIIFPKTCHFTAVIPCKMDIPKIAPTTACELETGTNGIVGSPYFSNNASSPCEAKRNRTIEWEITAIKADVDES